MLFTMTVIGKNDGNGPNLPESCSVEEDVKILKYIISHRAYNSLGGCKLWQDMVAKTLPDRTWHGLKERFRRRIANRLSSYLNYGIPGDKLKRLGQHFDSVKVIRKDRPTEGRRPYSREEDKVILNFIVKHKRQDPIGGKLIRVIMAENVKELRGRSWLSFKERFRRNILKNIFSYSLPEEDIKKFSNAKQHTMHRKEESDSSDNSESESRERLLRHSSDPVNTEGQPSTSGYSL